MFKSNIDPDIEYCYEKFRTAPIGSWSQAVGSFCMVMNEYWEFNADHTGKITSTGTFNNMTSEITFIWREVANYTIQCQITSRNYFDEENHTDDDEDIVYEANVENNVIDTKNETSTINDVIEEEYWETIRYCFKRIPTDVVELPSMCEVDSEGNILDRFWISSEPLHTLIPLNEPTQSTKFNIFPKICDVLGCFGLIGLLSELKNIFPLLLILLIALVPIVIFILADNDIFTHRRWKKFCDEGPLFAARWYLATTTGVISLIISGIYPKDSIFMLTLIIIGCYEPVKIEYERFKLKH